MTGHPPVRRDCTCPRARHRHGDYLTYERHGCRCFPCRLAWSAAKSRNRAGGSYAADPKWTPRIGTDRRLQALLALGWRHSDITARLAARGDSHATQSDQLLRRPGPWVWAETAAAVAAVYDELSMTPGPSERNRVRAAKLGYVPPLAWDDEDLDDPAAQPFRPSRRGAAWDHKPCGTSAAARRHHRRREPLCEACRAADRRARAERRSAA